MSLERIIFFDLETTSLHRVGQILNFCLVCVDNKWSELGRIKGEVKVSRVELPDPQAIASTGIDVVTLNNSSSALTERQAMEAMSRFMSQWYIKGKTGLSGYNVEDFDIPYLRTNFLRNGVYPYDHPPSHDTILLVRYLFANNDALRLEYETFLKDFEHNEKPRFSITLEKVTTFFRLLDRAQSHESEDDVNITIALAKKIATDFKLDLFSFTPYEISELHTLKGDPIRLSRPAKSFANPLSEEDFVFLRTEGSASYWVSLEAYNKWKKLDADQKEAAGYPIKRMKFCEEVVTTSKDTPSYDRATVSLAQTIYNELKNFDTNKLYPPKHCCVEQWIYRVTPQSMKNLCESIKQNPPKKMSAFTPDLDALWKRYLLSAMSDEGIQKNLSAFSQYAIERYGDTPSLRLYDDDDWQKPKDSSGMHLSYKELTSLIKTTKEKLPDSSSKEQKIFALNQLSLFYKNSLIHKVLTS